MTVRRKKKVLELQKKNLGIDVKMVSTRVWGSQIMYGKMQRIETVNSNEYYVTVHVKGELCLEDLAKDAPSIKENSNE